MACMFKRLFYVNGGTLAQVQLGLKSCICYEYHSYSPILVHIYEYVEAVTGKYMHVTGM